MSEAAYIRASGLADLAAASTRARGMRPRIEDRVLPTLLEAAGAEPAPEMQGRSFWPLLAGEDWQPAECIFAEMTFHQYYDPMRCVRTERLKYIRNFEMGPGVHVPSDIKRTPAYIENIERIYVPSHHPYEELYDLAADPVERNNVAGEAGYSELKARLSRVLADWMRRTGDPLLSGPVGSPFYRKSIGDLPA